jgi:hypothetical protein
MGVPEFIAPLIQPLLHDSSSSSQLWDVTVVADHLVPVEEVIRKWSTRCLPRGDHPYWNCLDSVGSSHLVYGIRDYLHVISLDGAPDVSYRIPGCKTVIEVVGSVSSPVFLVRDTNSQVRTFEYGTRSITPVNVYDSASRMEHSRGSEYAVSYTLPRVSIFAPERPNQPIVSFSEFARTCGGPIAFTDLTSLYYGDSSSVHLLDSRSGAVSLSMSPSKGVVSFSSYSDMGPGYSVLCAVDSVHLAAYSERLGVVQLFDNRKGMVDEWAIPGRCCKGVPGVKRMDFFEGNILCATPIDSYLIDISHPASPFTHMPTVPPLTTQIDAINADIKSSRVGRYLKKCPARKWQKQLTVSKYIRHVHDEIEISMGVTIAEGKVYSMTNFGRLLLMERKNRELNSKQKSVKSYVFTEPSTIDSVPGQKYVRRTDPIACTGVHAFLDSISEIVLRPTYKTGIPPLGRFFVYAKCGLAKIGPCHDHPAAFRAAVGSVAWTTCASVCGFKLEAKQKPRDPVGTVHVTTVGEIIFAFNEFFGVVVEPKDIIDCFVAIIRSDNMAHFPYHNTRIEYNESDVLKTSSIVSIRKSKKVNFFPVHRRLVVAREHHDSDSSDEDETKDIFSSRVPAVTRSVVTEIVSDQRSTAWMPKGALERIISVWPSI